MSITIEQSRLVDERRKNKHIEDTGYDYSQQVQAEIQALVEMTLDMGSMPSPSSTRQNNLVPRAGRTNGVLITQQDIDAYIAAHPQNSAREGDRTRIADILAAGNSTLDEEEPVEEQQEQPEEKPKIHSRFPKISENTTHYCKIVDSCYSIPNDDDDNHYRFIDASERLIVIDEFVGPSGAFSYAKSVDNSDYTPFYIKNSSIGLLSDELKPTPFEEDSVEMPGGEVPNWLNYKDMEVMKVNQNAEFRISVMLERQNLSSQDRSAALEEAFYKGVPKILEENGKRNDKEYIDSVFNSDQYWDKPAQAIELYLDSREGAKVKALVKVSSRNIIPLLEKEPEWAHKEEYDVEKFKPMVKKLITKIKDIDEKKKEFESEGGKVLRFHPSIEEMSLENSLAHIENLAFRHPEYAKRNKKIFEDKGKLRLYWDDNMKPVMVKFYSQAGKEYNLTDLKNPEVFMKYKATSGARKKRTQDLLMNLNFIVEENELEIPWKEFLTTFISYGPVEIIPKKEDSDEKTQGESEGPKVKSEKQFQEENNYYSNTDRIEEAFNKRKSKSEFAGAPVLNKSNSPSMGEIISQDAEDLYNHFLNKVDIGKIALQSAKCLMPDIPLNSFKSIKRDFEILEKELERLKKEHEEGKLLDFLQPDDLPTDDISEAFFKTLRTQLEKILTQVISSVVGNLLSAFFDSCNKNDKQQQSGRNPPEMEGVLADLQDKMQALFDAGFVDPEVFRNLMNDLANLLSLRELCDLLRGQPDNETLDIVKNLLEISYCQLGLDTEEEIVEFFLAVSGSMDLTICDELGEIMDSLPVDFICPPDSSVRDGLLRGKGLTDEEIRDQMAREKERNAKLAEQLIGDALSDRRGPNLFCAKDEQGNTIPGVMPFMDEQFEYTFETTLSSMFKPTYDSFTEEGLRYAQNLFMEVEEKEEKEYDMLGPIPDSSGDRPVGPQFTKSVLVTKRKPLPQLADFYKKPEFGQSTNSALELVIPTPAVSSIDRAKELFANAQGDNPFLLQKLDEMKESIKKQNKNVSKIKIRELKHCEVVDIVAEKNPPEDNRTEKQKRIDSIKSEIGKRVVRISQIEYELKTIAAQIQATSLSGDTIQRSVLMIKKKSLEDEKKRIESEIKNLQEELREDVYEIGLSENDCSDGSPKPQTSGREEFPEIMQPINQQNLRNFFIEGLAQNDDDCEVGPLYGNMVEISGKKYFSKVVISDAALSFMDEYVGADEQRDKENCIRAIFNKSLELKNFNENQKQSKREAFESSSAEIANGVRNDIYKVLMKMLKESKYLSYKSLGEDASAPSYDRYIMEFINLGPTATPECDPHLLKLAQLLQEVKDGMQEAMCLDLNPDPDSEKPKMSSLESAMMKACIRATFRHYIIENLVSGILTLTLFQGRRTKLTEIRCEYIVNKMAESMNRYAKPEEDGCPSSDVFSGDMPNYFNDFVEQVELTYGETNDGENSLLKKILKEEYKEISEGLLDALLISPTRESGVLYSFLSEQVPTMTQKVLINGTHLEYADGRNDELINPFIYLRKDGKDYFSLVTDTLSPGLTSSYKQHVLPDGSTRRWVIPIIERTNIEILNVQSTLFTSFFPLEDYAAFLSIHEMETVNQMDTKVGSFGETRDNLFSLFYAITPEKDDWSKQNKGLSSVGGSSGLTKLFDFNNNVFDTPCTEFSYNFGNTQVCWGNPFSGLGGLFAMALRMARDAALMEFKKYVMRNDPAVKLASRLSFLSKLACVNIPTSAIAGGLNAALPLIFPLTPMAQIFHALGLGIFLPSSLLNSDSEEGKQARDQIAEAGLRLPPYCGQPIEEEETSEYEQETLESEREEERRVEEINSQIVEKSLRVSQIDETLESLERRILNAFTSGNSTLKTMLENQKKMLQNEKKILEEEIESLRQQI